MADYKKIENYISNIATIMTAIFFRLWKTWDLRKHRIAADILVYQCLQKLRLNKQ